ncbi:hypothetical protein BH10ACT4_BH10ACT4_07350 [soil metagenome]
MTLYPHPLNRIANAAPGLVLGWSALGLVHPLWLSALALIAAVTLGLRGIRMSVTCTSAALVVRGMLLTRTIPKSMIASIPDKASIVPHVSWRDRRGEIRRTPLWVFAVGQSELSFASRRKITQLAKVRDWYRGR